jgi:hypothetical protein
MKLRATMNKIKATKPAVKYSGAGPEGFCVETALLAAANALRTLSSPVAARDAAGAARPVRLMEAA